MAPTRTKLATCDEESVPLVAPLVAEQKHAAHRSYAKVIAGGALAMLGAFACFAIPRPTVNLNAAGARLGGASSGEFTLHTGCSPLNKLSYGFSGAGTVGARMVSKSMSNDFRFEQAVEMKEVSCGNYAISDFSLEEGEEFGFYLYPIGDTSDETTVLDDGCLHEGDARCPAFASPAALVGGECAVKYTDPGSDDVFYNRVYDGSTTAYTWGSCEATCAVGQPDGCPSTATQSPSPSPSPPSLEEQCPISTSTADAGYVDAYRGWYDASGCGICQDYCRWVGNSGPGGDPSKKTTHGSSWWSCRAAKGTAPYTGKTEYGSTFGFAKCSGQGATPP